jgi:pimeloyl-ACP methyl ester carboxylesterase
MKRATNTIDTQTSYYDQFAEFARIEHRNLSIKNGVTLNTKSFHPLIDKGYPPIVFVPGFASVMESFTGTLIALAREFTVHYIETREKATSTVPENSSFSVRDIASDISEAVDMLDITAREYVLLTYSLGATAAAESFDFIITRKPLLLVLVEPSVIFRMPPWSLFTGRWFGWTFRYIKPLVKLYIKVFMVNTKEDYEMYMIIDRALDAANPKKLIATFLAISEYEIWDVLDKIDVPAKVIGASSDTFHSLGDAMEISTHIKGAEYIDMVTNKRTHSPEVAECIKEFIQKLSVTSPG